MCPYLFEVGGFQVGSYGLLMALGFLVTGFLLAREMPRRGMEGDWAWEIVLAAAVGGVVGARLLAVAEDIPALLADPFDTLFARGGLTWYGGFIGGAGSVLFVFWRRKLSFVTMADLTAPLLLLGYGFGRMGCHVSGDGCYGVPTDSFLGMAFPHGIVPTDIPVHPTPLYELAYSVLGFAVLWYVLLPRRLPRGLLFATYLVYSSVARFAVEFIRRNTHYWFSFEGGPHLEVNHYRPPGFESFAGFSLSQWLSIALFLWGAFWLLQIARRPRFDEPQPPGGQSGGESSEAEA